VCFYHTLDETIKTLWKLTHYGEPLHLPIDHQLISPLEDAWQACHKALQSAKPADRHSAEARTSILYQHACRFDA
jgi:hypothetical protein